MITNRRGALAAIGVAALGAVDWLIPGSVRANTLRAEIEQATQDSASADLARLGAHTYSEEGIPMFLACENLSANHKLLAPVAPPSSLNKKVASAFQRYVNEWQHLHPEAPASDVAKIVEVLADQDFSKGGTEKSL